MQLEETELPVEVTEGGINGRTYHSPQGDVWQDASTDRRTDEYCLSAPLISGPDFLCNAIIPPGLWTLNCIKLCQGGEGVPPLFWSVWKMTQMDTNYLSLRRFPLIALLASPNASKPALLHSPLTVTGCMLLNFLLRFQIRLISDGKPKCYLLCVCWLESICHNVPWLLLDQSWPFKGSLCITDTLHKPDEPFCFCSLKSFNGNIKRPCVQMLCQVAFDRMLARRIWLQSRCVLHI